LADEAAGGGERKGDCGVSPAKERKMRTNSGNGEGKNNNHDPTLRDHERARGTSGEAIHGEKKTGNSPDRQSARRHGQE
jgi:hypothetical protein